MSKKYKTWIFFSLIVIILVAVSTQVKVTYSVKGKGMFMSKTEFTLIRTLEGNLVSTLKDNIYNTTFNYDVTEFQRGDVVEFRLNENIVGKRFISEGDTLGFISSNEEQRNLIQLKGQLEVLWAQLEFHTTGQKPEDVLVATEQRDLANQELETQHKLMARTRTLIKDGVISEQEFEIEENRLKVKELEAKIAEANYLSVTTGEKPEQEKLIRAQIEALSWQISQIESRLNYFTITAPFSGRIQFPRSSGSGSRILTISDTAQTVGVVPVLLSDYNFIIEGGEAWFLGHEGTIAVVDDVVKLVDNRQAFFVTAVWPYNPEMKIGSVMEIKLKCDEISVFDLILRRFNMSTTPMA